MPGGPHNREQQCMRCSTCRINFPSSVRKCGACGGGLSAFANQAPDEDWVEEVHRCAPCDAAPSDVIAVKAGVKVRGAELFLSAADLIEAGVPYRLPDGTLVQVARQTFEVMGYSDNRREYWIRSFELGLTDEDAAWLAGR